MTVPKLTISRTKYFQKPQKQYEEYEKTHEKLHKPMKINDNLQKPIKSKLCKLCKLQKLVYTADTPDQQHRGANPHAQEEANIRRRRRTTCSSLWAEHRCAIYLFKRLYKFHEN